MNNLYNSLSLSFALFCNEISGNKVNNSMLFCLEEKTNQCCYSTKQKLFHNINYLIWSCYFNIYLLPYYIDYLIHF